MANPKTQGEDAVESAEDIVDPIEDARGSFERAADRDGKTSRRKVTAGARLAKLMGIQALIGVLALSLFAAADSWSTVTGLGLAGGLCVITGIVAGITLTTLVHEWFHFLGARFSNASYDIPTRKGLFLYDWDYSQNSVRQFFIMSIAGSVGGALAVLFLLNAVPADSWGRAALQGAAIGSFAFAASVEWPVLWRTRISREPLAELSKIDQGVLSRSFIIAIVTGRVITLMLVP